MACQKDMVHQRVMAWQRARWGSTLQQRVHGVAEGHGAAAGGGRVQSSSWLWRVT